MRKNESVQACTSAGHVHPKPASQYAVEEMEEAGEVSTDDDKSGATGSGSTKDLDKDEKVALE